MLRLNAITLSLALLFPAAYAVASATDTFDTHFLKGTAKDHQLSQMTLDPNAPYPGDYPLDIMVNGEWRGVYTLTVSQRPDNTCLSESQLRGLGIKLPASPRIRAVFRCARRCTAAATALTPASCSWI